MNIVLYIFSIIYLVFLLISSEVSAIIIFIHFTLSLIYSIGIFVAYSLITTFITLPTYTFIGIMYEICLVHEYIATCPEWQFLFVTYMPIFLTHLGKSQEFTKFLVPVISSRMYLLTNMH